MWTLYLLITIILTSHESLVVARLVTRTVVIESLMQCCGRSCTLMRPETITGGNPSGIKFNGTTVNYTTKFKMRHGYRFKWKMVSIHWEHNTTYTLAVRHGRITLEPTSRVEQANLFFQHSSSHHSYFSLRSQVAPYGYISSDMSGNVHLRNCRNNPFSWLKINALK